MRSNILSLSPKLNSSSLDYHNNLQNSLILSDNTTISATTTARNLGIILDSNLSFKQRISSLSKSCFYHIRDLRRVRSTLDFDTACTIAISLVHSKLDYCNSLYYILPHTHKSAEFRLFRTHLLEPLLILQNLSTSLQF